MRNSISVRTVHAIITLVREDKLMAKVARAEQKKAKAAKLARAEQASSTKAALLAATSPEDDSEDKSDR